LAFSPARIPCALTPGLHRADTVRNGPNEAVAGRPDGGPAAPWAGVGRCACRRL